MSLSCEPHQFAALMVEMAELYQLKLTDKICAMYWRDLGCYSLQALQHGWRQHRLTPHKGCFMPKPIDLIVHIQPTNAFAAEKSWAMLQKQVRERGPYQPFDYSDPLVRRIVSEMGGQHRLCQLSEQTLNHQRAYFMIRYQQYAEERDLLKAQKTNAALIKNNH